MKNNPVANLFPEENLTGNTEAILESLGKHGIWNLAYDGVIGCNPGYIFRGEAAFDCPLQSSLERSAHKKLKDEILIDGEKLRAEENQQITDFMNLTVGCQIDLLWMKPHQNTFIEYLKRKRHDQAWGWDRPFYQNPRLEAQRGMFVYPYDYPGTNGSSSLAKNSQSWFVQNLNLKTTDQFNLKNSVASLPPKRIRIESQYADNLRERLKQQYGISKGTIYERYML